MYLTSVINLYRKTNSFTDISSVIFFLENKIYHSVTNRVIISNLATTVYNTIKQKKINRNVVGKFLACRNQLSSSTIVWVYIILYWIKRQNSNGVRKYQLECQTMNVFFLRKFICIASFEKSSIIVIVYLRNEKYRGLWSIFLFKLIGIIVFSFIS